MGEQVARANCLDKGTLLNQESRCMEESRDRIPLVVSYHPALSELKGVVSRLQNMSKVSEEHKSLFRQQPLVVFRHVPYLMDNLVRTKLPKLQTELDEGYFRCSKSRCQICRFMSEGNGFRSNVSGNEFKISSRYAYDLYHLRLYSVVTSQPVGSILRGK